MDTKQPTRVIAVFGLGYVGCVTAACFAELGHRVVGIDVDARKVRAVLDEQAPFFEPGLEAIIQANLRTGRLSATTSTEEALQQAEFAFLCVGTPSVSNGNLNLDALRRVTAEIAEHVTTRKQPLTVVVRSTVFPGTCDEVLAPLTGRGAPVAIVSNPEFLREGSAVRDFMQPSLLVVGSHDSAAAKSVAALYAGLPVEPSLVALRTAELIKYTCNAFHALKISFANEIGTIAAALGLEGEEVMATVCRDTKLNISPAYLRPGFAFGGSCLPKDLRALIYRSRRLDLELPLMTSILPSNEAHIARAFRRVLDSGYRKVGIYGLAFKPNTDDLRESPGVALIERLIGKGCDVKIYDPHIRLESIYGSNQAFLLSSLPHIGRCMEKTLDGVLNWAEVIVTTQEPTAEVRESIASHGVPLINVTGSDGGPIVRMAEV
jgi:GDP-mannose 6-dehydrogenase